MKSETIIRDDAFVLAEKYICSTGTSVFLTGKAGTGKTTFLRYITETCPKRHIVLAPTGVAAINAGGSTIHSFFRLPLCPYLPDIPELVNEYSMPQSRHSLKKDRIRLIRTLELLIIDEVSMVRADLLDAVDMTLRRYRRSDRPFGGVQLLMIGDVQQLSPVVKDDERQYLQRVYPSPYFFDCKALHKLPYVTIELTRIHRQTDEEFIGILNAIREKRVSRAILDKLNSRVVPDRGAEEGPDEPIRLMTHVNQALSYNQKRLDALPGKSVVFDAEVDGEFPESMYPTDSEIELKVGARVMFIRNDPDGQYFNGKLGTVTAVISGTAVVVRDDDGEDIAVCATEWENTHYSMDSDSGEIRQEVIGKFTQIPLRTAWAITIHKSQGLTFDRVIIDASAAFSPGQVYVAMSRCRSLEGITLEHAVTASKLFTDEAVETFEKAIPSEQTVRELLPLQEKRYKFSCMRDVFDVSGAAKNLAILRKIWNESLSKIYAAEGDTLNDCFHKLQDAEKVSMKFLNQLKALEAAAVTDEKLLSERLSKASCWFLPSLEEIRDAIRKIMVLEIDNAEVRKRVRNVAEELLTSLEFHCCQMEAIRDNGFSMEQFFSTNTGVRLQDNSPSAVKSRLKKAAKVPKVTRVKGFGVTDDPDPSDVNEELRERLQEWRSKEFKARNIPAYQIMHQSTLLQIAADIPHSREELLAIKGISDKKFEQYGEAILDICSDF